MRQSRVYIIGFLAALALFLILLLAIMGLSILVDATGHAPAPVMYRDISAGGIPFNFNNSVTSQGDKVVDNATVQDWLSKNPKYFLWTWEDFHNYQIIILFLCIGIFALIEISPRIVGVLKRKR